MSSRGATSSNPSSGAGDGSGDFGPEALSFDPARFILQVMQDRQTGLRPLALGTGIGKSRLGSILHRDPAKRHTMTMVEYHALLAFFTIDPLDALIRIHPSNACDRLDTARHANLLAMLGEMVRGLASHLVEALEQVEGADGTEVRLEWAPALRQALVKRVVYEVNAVAARRANLSDFNIGG